MQSTEEPQSHRVGANPGTHESHRDATATSLFIPVKTTARLLDVSPLSVYRRFHSGQFPGRKVGRSIMILRSFAEALAAEFRSGRSVDVEAFAATWAAKASEVAS